LHQKFSRFNLYKIMAEPNVYYSANTDSKKQVLELKPKLGGFLATYIIFSLPGFISGIVWLIITIIVFFAVIAGFSSANADQENQNKLNLTELRKGNGNNGVLIYDLIGPIDTTVSGLSQSSRSSGIYTDLVAKDFAEIKKRNEIKNIVFRVNTPGGTVFASKVLGDQIADLIRSKGQKTAVFYFDQVVASGGLIAAYKNTDNYIVASPYGETGSIGVVLTLSNFKGLAEKVGYSETVIKSANSKDIGNPFRDVTSDEKSFLQKQVDLEYNSFIETVATGRKITKEKVKSIANGYVYMNSEAKSLNLFDEIGDVNKPIEVAAKNAGLDNYNVWEIKTEANIFESIFTGASANIFGLPKNTSKAIDRATFFRAGTMYTIDDTKI